MSNRTGTIGSLVLATVNSLGITVTAIVLILSCAVVVQPWLATNRIVESIQMRPDGVPVIMSYPSSSYSDQSFRTVDGQELDVADDATWLEVTLLRSPIDRQGRLSLPWERNIARFNDFRQPPGYWYFVYELQYKERGYFIGIDSRSKLLIGFIGTNGFSPAVPSSEEQFVLDHKQVSDGWGTGLVSTSISSRSVPSTSGLQASLPGWQAYMMSEGRLVEVNLRDRRVRTLLESDKLASLAIIRQGAISLTVEGSATRVIQPRQLLAIRYVDRVDLIDPTADDPSQAVSYPLPEELQITEGRNKAPWLNAFLTENGTLIYMWHTSTNSNHSLLSRLVWVEPDGSLSRTENIKLAFPGPTSSAWLAVVSPVAGTVFPTVNAFAAAYEQSLKDDEMDFSAALGQIVALGWPALVSTYLASGLSVWMCLRRQRRYGASGTTMWVVFVAIFGLPGLLGYVWSRRWPPLETCAKCGKPASQDHDCCHLCGEDFVRPPLQGTEVFA